MNKFDPTALERNSLTLGVIPLTDCAVLVMAQAAGFFAKYGLEVTLSVEASWANIRDKVQAGILDGAQMLAAMPIASTLGISGAKTSMVTAFSLGLNGNAITVSNKLFQRMLETDAANAADPSRCAHALKKIIDADKYAGRKPMTFAMVFPFSSHNYQLRYWLATAGINPDVDVQLTVVPPPQMVDNLHNRNIDGFCVGAPWNTVAATQGIGKTLLTGHEIWNNSPEKVFSVTNSWAEANPNTYRAVLMALLEAAEWTDQPENRQQIVKTLVAGKFVNVEPDVLEMSMLGTFKFAADEAVKTMPDFNVFHRYAANYPWLSHAEWFILQMVRWGQLNEPVDIRALAKSVYRPDIYTEVAACLGKPCPLPTHKTEGRHSGNWSIKGLTEEIVMGADRFIDGKYYDPGDPVDYLRKLPINRLGFSLDDLAQLNPRAPQMV